MTSAASYAANTERLRVEVRALEALDLAWRSLSATYENTLSEVSDRHSKGNSATPGIARLTEIAELLTTIEHQVIDTLTRVNALVTGLDDV